MQNGSQKIKKKFKIVWRFQKHARANESDHSNNNCYTNAALFYNSIALHQKVGNSSKSQHIHSTIAIVSSDKRGGGETQHNLTLPRGTLSNAIKMHVLWVLTNHMKFSEILHKRCHVLHKVLLNSVY